VDLTRFDALTFDCYGTLVDWERGILAAVDELSASLSTDFAEPASTARDRAGDRERLLALFGRLEAEAERGAFRTYRSVLADVARGLGAELGVEVTPERADAFADSVGDWPPFVDTVVSLRALAGRYRLAIVSNVDDDLFARTAKRLEVPFDEVVTAEQVRSYKPAPAHFHEALRRLDVARDRVLHVAQSLYHDVAPARALGISCVWVNRRAGRAGWGATPEAVATPDLEVRDLASLVRAAGLA